MRAGLALAALGLGDCSESPSSAAPAPGPGGAQDARAPRAAGQAGWEKICGSGVPGHDSPTAGEDMAVVYDARRQRLFLYGGKGDDEVILNELWTFDLEARSWRRILSAGPLPPAREDHTLVLDADNDQLVLFGGEDGETSNATWTYDLHADRWSDITSKGAPAIEGHAAIYDPRRKRMVVFGGMRVKDDEKDLEEETWALDLDEGSAQYRTWSTLRSGAARPPARREHDGVYDPLRHRLLIFGGRQRSSGSFLSDVWMLDLDRDAWNAVETHGARPNPVRQTALGFDPEANELTVFGGEVLASTSGQDRKEFPVNQVWVLGLDSGLWTDRTPYPPSMYDHAGLFVPEYGTMLIYGGSSLHAGKEHSTWLIRKLEPAPGSKPSTGTR